MISFSTSPGLTTPESSILEVNCSLHQETSAFDKLFWYFSSSLSCKSSFQSTSFDAIITVNLQSWRLSIAFHQFVSSTLTLIFVLYINEGNLKLNNWHHALHQSIKLSKNITDESKSLQFHQNICKSKIPKIPTETAEHEIFANWQHFNPKAN